MKACTLVVAARSGTGTQVVTGVVDRDGAPFTPKAFIVFGNGVAGAVGTYCHVSYGMDDGTTHRGQSFDEVFQSGGKIVSANSGAASIQNAGGNIFFGGDIFRVASVTAVASGQFTITYTTNTNTGDSFIVTCLGGDDLNAKVATSPSGNTFTTGFDVEAVLTQNQAGTSTVATAGGGGGGFGWATSDGNMGASAVAVIPQGGNAHYQVITQAAAILDQASLGSLSSTRTITNFGATGFTVSASPSGYSFLAVGGMRATAGRLTQPAAAGDQVVLTGGIVPRLVLLMSVDQPASTTVSTSGALWSLGSADGTRQASYWTGETVVGNTTLLGARYLSTNRVLAMATPNAGSTTVHSQAEMRTFLPLTPAFTLHWNFVDGTERDVLWLVLGDEETPTIPVTRQIRRLRRFAHLNQTHLLLFIDQFELYVQSGVGNSDAPNPQIMLRYSKDGGHTWSPERWMSAGQVGEYGARLRWMQLGKARDWVFEIVASDPVVWNLIEAWANVREGSS